MSDRRLIEEWFPIADLSEESTRERRSMTALPPIYYLHVWWARRPLVASRAAVLASLLPAGADRERFKHVLGIHGDPVAARRRIEVATRKGERLGAAAYGYKRAFTHSPDRDDRVWMASALAGNEVVLDPTAGGGSIPFETVRLGLETWANDLNPVAALIERATIEWPMLYGTRLVPVVQELGSELVRRVRRRLVDVFPDEGSKDLKPDGYLWARTIRCPYCHGLVPLSPNWRLAPGGIGVRLTPHLGDGPGSPDRVCSFEIVTATSKQSPGTVARGTGTCPYSDCGHVIDGDEIKLQAQDGEMGEQLYAVVYKKRVKRYLKSGRPGKDRWVRDYRAPCSEDDNTKEVMARLEQKLPEWEALDIIPSEPIPEGSKTAEPHVYGMPYWRDLFSPRQLLCQGTSVEVYREMLEEDRAAGALVAAKEAAYGYLALALDKVANYNSLLCVWHSYRSVIANTFKDHNFSLAWSYAEMAPLIAGVGYDWAIRQTAKCINELVELTSPDANSDNGELFDEESLATGPPRVTITCKSADSLDHIEDGSVDAVVIDPPYYDNVMYAELSDFFYVWLKRTAGHVFPELFRTHLADKDNEAIASPARFRGQKGARALAGRDYQERMAAIFAECHRTLKADGIMTLMFTHKDAGAWDALTKGLMEAGFAITASWPVNTEAPGSMHIKDKASANSTIFLVCRPRRENGSDLDSDGRYWEDIEPLVATAVRKRVSDFQKAGIKGVDLYLASFGPALEEFSRYWPLRRGTPREKPEQLRRRRQIELFEEKWDPYAATPEDALDVARREVKRWRLEQLADLRLGADLDPATAFFVLAWDAFGAPKFSYDEALKLARAVDVDLERDVVGHFGAKMADNMILWDSSVRAAKGALGPADGSRGMVDAIHHAATLARVRSLEAAREMLGSVGVDRSPRFATALEAVLEALPVSRSYRGFDLDKKAAGLESASLDFEVLENLRRLAFSDRIDEPEQLRLWRDGGA
ncbi:MAG: DUF1156 domain-containing protein [Gemmatimonadota bacterium]|nr:DUF1156 domain-containing protein [Gemmatimonadota bacterium]